MRGGKRKTGEEERMRMRKRRYRDKEKRTRKKREAKRIMKNTRDKEKKK